ncbi:MAG: hypothetical protein Q4Q23_04465 [Methanobacteriaceae archaeon]|nr:hypothetical protein [Methanobacteriaceae archaeon]
MYTLKRKNAYERITSTLFSKNKPNFSNIKIISIILLFTLILTNILDWNALKEVTFISSIITGLILTQPIPLKKNFKIMVLLSILLSLVVFTSMLSSMNGYLFILFLILWLSVFIFTNILGDSYIIIGFSSIIVFVLSYTQNFSYLTNSSIILALKYMILTFFIILIEFTPIILYRYYKKDPIKKELLSKLFEDNLPIKEFNNITHILLSVNDNFTQNLINIALELRICNYNIVHLKKDLNNKPKEELFNIINKEYVSLINQIIPVIKSGKYNNYQIDLTKLYHISEKIKKENNSSIEYLNLYKLTYSYIKIFKSMNNVFNNPLYETKKIHETYDNKTTIKTIRKTTTLKNHNIKYAIQLVTTILLTIIIDFIMTSMTATLSGIFTVKKEVNFTINKAILRIFGNIGGLIFGILLSTTFYYFNLSFLIPIFAVICLLIFFAYLPNHSSKTVFFIMAMVMLLSKENYLISGFQRFIASVVGSLIGLIIGLFIFPIFQKENITHLIIKKLDYSSKILTSNIQQDQDKINKNLHELFIINSELETNINRINENYKDIDTNLKNIQELSIAINNLIENSVNMNQYLKATNNKLDFNRVIKEINELFIEIKINIYSNKNINKNKTFNNIINELNNLEKESTLNKQIVLRYLKWMSNDLEFIDKIISESKLNDTFNILNQEL